MCGRGRPMDSSAHHPASGLSHPALPDLDRGGRRDRSLGRKEEKKEVIPNAYHKTSKTDIEVGLDRYI